MLVSSTVISSTTFLNVLTSNRVVYALLFECLYLSTNVSHYSMPLINPDRDSGDI